MRPAGVVHAVPDIRVHWAGETDPGVVVPVVAALLAGVRDRRDGAAPPTKALLDTCFRQVEYAGVLRGTKNPDGARKLIDFLLSPAAQATIPDAMYVYPVTRGVPLPEAWAKYAPVPPKAATLPADRLADERDGWVRQWRQLMGR